MLIIIVLLLVLKQVMILLQLIIQLLLDIIANWMTQVERGVLTVSGGKRETDDKVAYLHQGIAQRAFRLSFRLADHIEVRGASLTNGLLNIDLLREVPEEAKPKRIMIGGETKPELRQVSLQ